MGFAGTKLEDMERDAGTFAGWGADMLKLDGCFRPTDDFDVAYPRMARALNATGRPIVFSCSWPYYVRTVGKAEPDYALIAKHCNLWRNFDDIAISWASVRRIIDFYDREQEKLAEFHGPGHWNDPDMLVVGNPGISADQARTQMALWCLWSAPLLMSNDLRDLPAAHKEVLLNRRLIAVDQDPLGRMGRKVLEKGPVRFYAKPMRPVVEAAAGEDGHSYAIVIFNSDPVSLKEASVTLRQLGLTRAAGYSVQELFGGEELGHLTPEDALGPLRLNPTASAAFKATAVRASAHALHGLPLRGPLGLPSLPYLLFGFSLLLLVWLRRRRVLRLCRV